MTNNHAIVIGGSMAGLVVARILSDRFEQVTLIERDQFPSGLKPPGTLFQPRIAIQVLRQLFKFNSAFLSRTSHSE